MSNNIMRDKGLMERRELTDFMQKMKDLEKLPETANVLKLVESSVKNKNKKLSLVERTLLSGTVGILEQNYQKNMQMLEESTQWTNNVGALKKYNIDLLVLTMNNLIAPDIVSVIPMDRERGEILCMQLIADTTKSNTKAGDVLKDPFGRAVIDPNYSNERLVKAFTLTTTTQTLAMGETVNPLSIRFFLDNLEITAAGRAVQGKVDLIESVTGNAVGTADKDNVYLALTALPKKTAIEVMAEKDNIREAPYEAAELRVEIKPIPIDTTVRALRAKSAMLAQFSIQKDFGLNLNNILQNEMAKEIAEELDAEIILLVKTAAMRNLDPVTGDAYEAKPFYTIPNIGYPAYEHVKNLHSNIIDAEGIIREITNGKYRGSSFILTGRKVTDKFRELARYGGAFEEVTYAQPSNTGPALVGYLNKTIAVYEILGVPGFESTEYVVGIKPSYGDLPIGSGIVWGVYMPIVTTPLILDSTFQASQGVMSVTGLKVIDTRLYVRGEIIEEQDPAAVPAAPSTPKP